VPSDLDTDIDAFLSGDVFAVAGASVSRRKYGNRVLRCYFQRGRHAVPVNPHHAEIEGARCYPHLADVPERVHGVSLITRPRVSAAIVDEALELGIRHFWFQPGAEHRGAMERAREAGAVVIGDGPCILVVLRYDAHG
jgi:predicted CoA-binding protein